MLQKKHIYSISGAGWELRSYTLSGLGRSKSEAPCLQFGEKPAPTGPTPPRVSIAYATVNSEANE